MQPESHFAQTDVIRMVSTSSLAFELDDDGEDLAEEGPASHASMARAVVSSKVGYTKRWRERTAVKIQARRERGDAFRLQLPEPGGA